MRNKTILLLSVFFMLFIIPISYANPNWWMEGNSDNNLGDSGFSWSIYGSSINNPYPEIEYSKCTIGGSLFNPVIDDLDYDNKREIVTTGSNKLNLYDMDCNLDHVINVFTSGSSYFLPTPRDYNFGFYAGYPDTYYNNTDYVLVDDTSYKHTILNESVLRFIEVNITPEVFTENVTLNMILSPYNSSNYGQTIYFTNFNGNTTYANLTMHNTTNLTDYNISIVGALGQQHIYIRGLENNTGVTWDYLQVVLNIETSSENTPIKAPPVLMNSFENGVPEIYTLTNETLNIYQYSNASRDFIMVYSFDYYDEFSVLNLDSLSCVNDYYRDPICQAFKTGSQVVYTFNIDELEMDSSSELTYAMESKTGSSRNGVTNSRTDPYHVGIDWFDIFEDTLESFPALWFNYKVSRPWLELLGVDFDLLEDTLNGIDENFITPACLGIAGSSNNIFLCNMLSSDGSFVNSIGSSQSVGAGNTINWSTSSIAKHGSQFRLFVTYRTTSADYLINEVYDLDGNELYQDVISSPVWDTTSSGQYLTNWMVADYDKDGQNEACYFRVTAGSNYLRCLEDDFTYTTNTNVSAGLNLPFSDMVMADFVPTSETLCFGCRNGIFCQNGTSMTQIYNSGLGIVEQGSGLTTYSDDYYSPAYIYTSLTSGMVIKNPLANTDCGNDICDSHENFWNCPIDCNISLDSGSIETDYDEGEYPVGYGCVNDSQCESGLKCQYGVCSKSGLNEECDDDDDCVSEECINNLCTKPSWWQGIDASKDQLAGDDNGTNNFIALTIMIVSAGLIIVGGRSLVAVYTGLATFFTMGIFFAVVGWLSAFLVLGMIVVGLLGIVLWFISSGTE